MLYELIKSISIFLLKLSLNLGKLKLITAVGIFLFQTLDAIDGKQARRTNLLSNFNSFCYFLN